MKARVPGRLRRPAIALLLVLGGVVGVAPVADSTRAGSPPFVAVDLGSLGGDSSATDVSDAGQVVGYSADSPAGGNRAFSWTRATGMVELDKPRGIGSIARAVNNVGQVVGVTFLSAIQAFVWTQAGGMVEFGPPEGGTYALDVNDAGQVIGFIDRPSGVRHGFLWSKADGFVEFGRGFTNPLRLNEAGLVVGGSDAHAFLWTRARGLVDLGTLGGQLSVARAVNSAGQIVGDSQIAGPAPSESGPSHAFSWTARSGMIDLGTLGGVGSEVGDGNAVNDAGEVVGSSDNHAFIWTQARGMSDLGTLGGLFSVAQAVNDAGQVVGVSTTASGVGHAFSWTRAAGMVDLGTLGGDYSAAVAVNDVGEVVGWSYTVDGQRHATLWEPTNRDTVAPVLQVPASVTADATSPAGTTVSYDVSAVDAVDPAPVVTCAPASATLFAIGDTVVTCTATDSSGNASSASFVVHVRGAAEQLAVLAAAIVGVGPGASLADKVKQAQAALTRDDRAEAASILRAFTNQVAAQSGKTIPADTAAALAKTAARISAAIG